MGLNLLITQKNLLSSYNLIAIFKGTTIYKRRSTSNARASTFRRPISPSARVVELHCPFLVSVSILGSVSGYSIALVSCEVIDISNCEFIGLNLFRVNV